jgi:probable rRNA maturation factor
MPRVARKSHITTRIDVRVDSDLWKAAGDVRSTARRAIKQAASLLSAASAELAIVLTDDSAIRALNRAWRGVDAATNVLSFPTSCAVGEPPLIGDIILAYETVAAEAFLQQKPLSHHVAHLALHGYLHLLGYEHVRNKDAELMEAIEREVLWRLAIPDPYRRSRSRRQMRLTSAAQSSRR